MNALRRFGRWVAEQRLYRANGWDLQGLVALSMTFGFIIGVWPGVFCGTGCWTPTSPLWLLLFPPVLAMLVAFELVIVWAWRLLWQVESYPTNRAVEETLKEMEKEVKNGQLGADQCASGCDLCQHRE